MKFVGYEKVNNLRFKNTNINLKIDDQTVTNEAKTTNVLKVNSSTPKVPQVLNNKSSSKPYSLLPQLRINNNKVV